MRRGDGKVEESESYYSCVGGDRKGNYIFNSGEVRGRGGLRIYCIHIGTASTEITVDQMAEHPLQDHLHVETDLRVKCPGGGTREALVRQGDDKEGGTDVAKLEIEAGEREGSVR
ncbi:hypothetical protein QJS10_CPA05g01430 [Acorus calamus]|uniref:Uncharacterized protein n=1 Tax=Acorus calamus TaxID=4465 RepID=A0AAV9EU53_ACOCL|nr:hypothetical protein QJS10_CPA05g01430 [Acorus calamus]